MITAVASAEYIFVANILPWKNSTAWTADFQTKTDEYNTWLAAQASVQGFTLIDQYTEFESTSADELDAIYDSGDGLHLNNFGQEHQASFVLAALNAQSALTMVETVNEYKRWRGAVEPAEVGASGNQFKAWRGAVEPAFVATTTNGRKALARSSVPGLTRGLTRGLAA